MKVGDLVIIKNRTFPVPGVIMRIDKDYYGARQAIKIYQNVSRGKCIRSNMGDGIGPTTRGIRDRVMVIWPEHGFTYEESTKLEVIK